MNNKKHSAGSVILAILAGMISTGCTVDAYDKGEGQYSNLTAELVQARVGTDKSITQVLTDRGEALRMETPATAKWIEKGDTTYRALLYYNIVEDGLAAPVSISRVGVLAPRDSIKGAMKTDPLYVESVWKARNGQYLNMRLRLLTGSTDDEKAIHTIGLLRDTLASTATHQHMTLYHDQGGMPEYYSTVTYASIPLSSVTADSITITVNTYDRGLVKHTVALKDL
ncbi:MAG: NigD-like N-terminal domain-containing protein [Prevotella sp.]|nr:NigD-like N-terminal domain-containing protein [Prevotella sp.]